MTLTTRSALASLTVLCLAAPAAAQNAQEIDDAITMLEEEFGSDALQDPTDIFTWVTFPHALKVGEVAPLEVTIENARAEGAFRLSSIDLGDGFLDGFEVAGFDPEPRQQDHSLGTLTLEYPLDIPADGKRTFVVKLRATKAGTFIGDVDVYEGARFLTRVAQARVK